MHKGKQENFLRLPVINPFLAVFAGNDPVTNGMLREDVLKMAPNAKSAPHIGGGHFFQWTKPKQLSKVIVDFIKE
jgi:haloalkane dehalogenase